MKKRISSLKSLPAQADIYSVPSTAVKSLADNIAKLGQLEPLIITPDNVLLSGYTRVEALKLLGIKTADVKIVDVPEGERVYFLISANKQRVKDYVCRLAEADALTEYYSKGQGKRSDLTEGKLLRSERRGNRKTTIQLVAAELGMSTKTIQQLRYIKKENPDLIQHIGKHITLASCYAQVKLYENQKSVIGNSQGKKKSKCQGDRYTIYNKPAQELTDIVEDGSVDVIMTSPPYYQQRQYGGEGELGQEATIEEFIDNLVNIFDACTKVLKRSGHILININDTYKDGSLQQVPFRLSIAIADRLKLKLRNTLIWDKMATYVPESTDRRRHVSHDYIFHYVKDVKSYYYDPTPIRVPYTAYVKEGGLITGANARWANKTGNGQKMEMKKKTNVGATIRHPEGRIPGSVLHIDNRVRMVGKPGELVEHTSPYPTKLIDELLAPIVKPDDVVLDPFSGSGSTGVSAIKLGAKYIGFETNNAFIELSDIKIKKSIKSS